MQNTEKRSNIDITGDQGEKKGAKIIFEEIEYFPRTNK